MSVCHLLKKKIEEETEADEEEEEEEEEEEKKEKEKVEVEKGRENRVFLFSSPEKKTSPEEICVVLVVTRGAVGR